LLFPDHGLNDGMSIGNAHEYIYIENQYFNNRYIVKALKSALERNEELELIMVLNGNPNVPTYRFWHPRRLEKLGLDVKEPIIDKHDWCL
jgi:hypothetical protein